MSVKTGKKKKRTVFPIGVNAHKHVDNLITLYRSSNDLYDGTLDYIYFRVLNLEPISYFNMNDETDYSESEIEEFQNAFSSFHERYENETSDTISSDVKNVILFIREKALSKNYIKEVYKGIYLEDNHFFNFDFMLRCIMDFYKKIRKGEF